MTLNELQAKVHKDIVDTVNPTSAKEAIYAGLFEEAGEIAGIHKRQHRMGANDLARITRECIVEEVGDLLWYLVALCCIEGISLQEVVDRNTEKLEERYGRREEA